MLFRCGGKSKRSRVPCSPMNPRFCIYIYIYVCGFVFRVSCTKASKREWIDAVFYVIVFFFVFFVFFLCFVVIVGGVVFAFFGEEIGEVMLPDIHIYVCFSVFGFCLFACLSIVADG